MLVDPSGLEPPTSAMSRQRSNQLSYGSIKRLRIIQNFLDSGLTLPNGVKVYLSILKDTLFFI